LQTDDVAEGGGPHVVFGRGHGFQIRIGGCMHQLAVAEVAVFS
jgi:hypothetical protein